MSPPNPSGPPKNLRPASLGAGVLESLRAAVGVLFSPDRKPGDTAEKVRHFRRLMAFAWPYRFRLGASMVLVVLGTALTLASMKMWKYLVDGIVSTEALTSLGPIPLTFGWVTVLIISLFLAQGLVGFTSSYILGVVGLRVTLDLRMRLFEHLQRLSFAFYSERRTGELVSRLMNDVATVRGLVTGDLTGLLRQILLFFGALTLILVTDWRLTIFMFLLIPTVSVLSLVLGRLINRLSREVQDEFAAVTTVAEEVISGVRIVRSFVRERHETERFRSRLIHLLALSMRRLHIEVLFGPLVSVLFFSATVAVIWYGGQRVISGELTTGDLVVFITLTSVMGGSISYVAGLWTRLQQALGSSQRLFELLDVEAEIRDAPDAVELPALEGSIALEGVSFAYAGSGGEDDVEPRRVLKDVSLTVPPGETLALVGPSGAGKTTLVNLVPRFFDVTGGRILIDGVDVRSVKLDDLRGQIGIVPQDTHLFGGTIRDNIVYGRLEATDQELEQAARDANAYDFIRELPQGFDTVVGERGVKLSGGQRQRIAIARALLKNPRVLILDEATSALDTESERLVQEALECLMAGRTSVVIAHRLSTVRNAHRIAVLRDGELVELGTHEELIALGGLYDWLYKQQFRDEKDAEDAQESQRLLEVEEPAPVG